MEKRQRLFILGDSVGFTWPKQGQKLNESWPAIVKDALPQIDVWQRCRIGAPITVLSADFKYFVRDVDQFSGFIIQIGIIDCCPRPIPFWLHEVTSLMSARLVRWIRSKYLFLLKFRARPWVKPDQFKKSFRAIIASIQRGNPEAKVGIIPIAEGRKSFLLNVSDINQYVAQYNAILREVQKEFQDSLAISILDPYRGCDFNDLLLEDGFHLTKAGHAKIAEAVLKFLSAL